MTLRRPLFVAVVIALLSLSAFGCDAIIGPSPQPTNCGIGLVGQYRLDTPAGDLAAATEEAGRIINARLQRTGLARFAVLTRTDGTIEVDLQPIAEPDEFRELIDATGHVTFVPIPEDASVEAGDQISADWPVMFGREGIASAQPSTSAAGQDGVEIVLTPIAAQVFADHSTAHVGSQVAIVVDGVVFAAPVLQVPIVDGHVQISGGMTAQEANRLVAILALPPLPGNLTELSFGPFTPPASCPAGE